MGITTEQKENIQLCVDALKVNEKKAIRMMRDKDGGRCCLCVIQDTLKEKYPDEYDERYLGSYLPDEDLFIKLLGFSSQSAVTIDGEHAELSNHNDSYNKSGIVVSEKSHVQIAEAIELKFLK